MSFTFLGDILMFIGRLFFLMHCGPKIFVVIILFFFFVIVLYFHNVLSPVSHNLGSDFVYFFLSYAFLDSLISTLPHLFSPLHFSILPYQICLFHCHFLPHSHNLSPLPFLPLLLFFPVFASTATSHFPPSLFPSVTMA